MAPSRVRWASLIAGRLIWRRGTVSWWRRTMISRSLERQLLDLLAVRRQFQRRVHDRLRDSRLAFGEQGDVIVDRGPRHVDGELAECNTGGGLGPVATRTTGRVQIDGTVGVPGVVPGVTAVGGLILFIVSEVHSCIRFVRRSIALAPPHHLS